MPFRRRYPTTGSSVVDDIITKHPQMKTMVSKDINLRMKARSGMLAEDYITDKVTKHRHLRSGEVVIEGVNRT